MTFQIQWMTFNGAWRIVRTYKTRKAAVDALRLLGLIGNPAYRVVKG